MVFFVIRLRQHEKNTCLATRFGQEKKVWTRPLFVDIHDLVNVRESLTSQKWHWDLGWWITMFLCHRIFGNEKTSHLVGGFNYFLFSPRKLGKMKPFWGAFFSKGLVQPPTRHVFIQHGSNSWMCMSWFEKVVNFMASQPTSMLSTPMRNKALIRPYWGKNYG